MTDCQCPDCTAERNARIAAETLKKLGYDELAESVIWVLDTVYELAEELEQNVELGYLETVH